MAYRIHTYTNNIIYNETQAREEQSEVNAR